MRWWVYKCNSRQRYNVCGDWQDFFKRPDEHWGCSQRVPELRKLREGDLILAYQTNRNALMGVAEVRQSCDHDDYLYLTPVRTFDVKIRPLRKAYPVVERIPAFQPGPIQTVYEISGADVQRLLRAAGIPLNRILGRGAAGEGGPEAEQVFIEGERRATTSASRDPRLRAAAKEHWGLTCYCCGFHFERFYGSIARGLAIVHHLQTFSADDGGRRRSSVEEVRVVCANCHQVIHTTDPPTEVDELRNLISDSWGCWTEEGIWRKVGIG
jgi:hypothetical protein